VDSVELLLDEEDVSLEEEDDDEVLPASDPDFFA
jgi:hypothetical protein